MLVVADELTLGIGRKGGLTRTRQTEEDSRLALLVGVCRAVHRSHALQREQVVHVREHTLLHLAAVPRVDDDLHLLREVEHDSRLRVESELLVVLDLGLRCVQHDEVGLAVVGQLLLGGADEHVLHEVRLPCHLHDEADLQARVLVCTAEGIHDIELLIRQLLAGQLLQHVPCLLRHGLVVVLILIRSPPNGVLGRLVLYEELVLGRTAGVYAGHYVNGTHVGYHALIETGQTRLGLLLEQRLVRGVVEHLLDIGDAVLR